MFVNWHSPICISLLFSPFRVLLIPFYKKWIIFQNWENAGHFPRLTKKGRTLNAILSVLSLTSNVIYIFCCIIFDVTDNQVWGAQAPYIVCNSKNDIYFLIGLFLHTISLFSGTKYQQFKPLGILFRFVSRKIGINWFQI